MSLISHGTAHSTHLSPYHNQPGTIRVPRSRPTITLPLAVTNPSAITRPSRCAAYSRSTASSAMPRATRQREAVDTAQAKNGGTRTASKEIKSVKDDCQPTSTHSSPTTHAPTHMALDDRCTLLTHPPLPLSLCSPSHCLHHLRSAFGSLRPLHPHRQPQTPLHLPPPPHTHHTHRPRQDLQGPLLPLLARRQARSAASHGREAGRYAGWDAGGAVAGCGAWVLGDDGAGVDGY